VFECVGLRISLLASWSGAGGGECVCWGRLHVDKIHDLHTARNMVTEMDVEFSVLVVHVDVGQEVQSRRDLSTDMKILLNGY
jgi:predicted RNase H-related nuclease YkuK (DUF458 family)